MQNMLPNYLGTRFKKIVNTISDIGFTKLIKLDLMMDKGRKPGSRNAINMRGYHTANLTTFLIKYVRRNSDFEEKNSFKLQNLSTCVTVFKEYLCLVVVVVDVVEEVTYLQQKKHNYYCCYCGDT